MPLPSFSAASLKDKVAHAKSASISKYQETKDRLSSTPSSSLTADGRTYYKSPPPRPSPIPAATAISSSNYGDSARPNPQISRSTKPIIQRNESNYASEKQDIDKIDWENLSFEDKQVFFSWLDEFFGRYFNTSVPHSTDNNVSDIIALPQNSSLGLGGEVSNSHSPTSGPPPPIRTWSRPKDLSISNDTASVDFTMSHPPATTHGCSALDLAYFFKEDTTWDSTWYNSDNALPPPLENRKDIRWTSSFSWTGTSKTMNGGVLFSDLSICWFTVQFSTSNPGDARRYAEYLPRPSSMSKDILIQAYETYGDTIASFAENFVGTGQFCARGECWDMASEAIKYFEQFDYVPEPIPSISRTHGHLIFEGKALGKGQQVGRWRGGDSIIRRGDIVEWRKVRINVVGAPRGSYALLGDPDHTAVITADCVPKRLPKDGDRLLPSELVQLEVVEQSLRSLPDKKVYDMAALEEGEVWIYRPIAMQSYLVHLSYEFRVMQRLGAYTTLTLSLRNRLQQHTDYFLPLFMTATTINYTGSTSKFNQKYTIIVRDEQFTLRQSQIEFDAPNYFTACFFGEFRESERTSIILDRNPDLFAIILEYMSGYSILPLNLKALPRTMDTQQALKNLAEDAAFYGLSRLHDLLTKPRPADIDFSWTGFSSRVIGFDDLLRGNVSDVNYTTSGLCSIEHGNAPRPVVIFARNIPLRLIGNLELFRSGRPPPNTSTASYRLDLNDEQKSQLEHLPYGEFEFHDQSLRSLVVGVYPESRLHIDGQTCRFEQFAQWWRNRRTMNIYETDERSAAIFENAFPRPFDDISRAEEWDRNEFVLWGDELLFVITARGFIAGTLQLHVKLLDVKARTKATVLDSLRPLVAKTS